MYIRTFLFVTGGKTVSLTIEQNTNSLHNMCISMHVIETLIYSSSRWKTDERKNQAYVYVYALQQGMVCVAGGTHQRSLQNSHGWGIYKNVELMSSCK